MTGPDTPNRFSDTFAAHPGGPPRGLLPGLRVWATVTGAAALVGAVLLLLPLLSAGSGHGGRPAALTVADAARTPTAPRPATPTATTPTATATPTAPATTATPARTHAPAAPRHTAKATGGAPHGTGTTTHRTTTAPTPRKTTAPARTADPGPPPPPPGSTVYNPNSGKCLSGSAGSDGTPLQLWTCNGNVNQQWTFASDGTIRTKGLCMDAAWGATADGTIVQIAYCSGNPAQQFALGSDGLIHAEQSGKCVDLWQGDSADGAAIKLYQCTGTWGQHWNRK